MAILFLNLQVKRFKKFNYIFHMLRLGLIQDWAHLEHQWSKYYAEPMRIPLWIVYSPTKEVCERRKSHSCSWRWMNISKKFGVIQNKAQS